MATPLQKFAADLLPTDDGSGDCFLIIPDEIMKLLELHIGDPVNIEPLADRSISISKCLDGETSS